VERRRRTIAGVRKLLIRRIRTLSIRALGTNSSHDALALQIRSVRLWRIRIIARLSNIVDVEICCFRQGAFDVVIAGVICIFAGGIAAGYGSALLEEREAGRGVGREVGIVLRGTDK
jgi:hypothetical protein